MSNYVAEIAGDIVASGDLEPELQSQLESIHRGGDQTAGRRRFARLANWPSTGFSGRQLATVRLDFAFGFLWATP